MPRLGYNSLQTIEEGFDEVIALGGSVVSVFHSPIAATDAALDMVRAKWPGPICVYPEAERRDYVATYRNDNVAIPLTPAEFVDWAAECVAAGVQIVGACCGIEIDHMRPFREALPTHLP